MKKVLVAITLLLPLPAGAGVLINEIMQNAAGPDASHEWVELFVSNADTDLAGFKFYEAETNHSLKLVSGSSVVAAGGFAIIADNGDQFLADHPGFVGAVFDSSFSLSNTGESLAIKDGIKTDFDDNGTVLDQVTYSADPSLEDGNSLNRSGSDWVRALPTPGALNASAPAPAAGAGAADSSANSSSSVNTSALNSNQNKTVGNPTNQTVMAKPKITADGGADQTVVVGAAASFTGKALGLNGDPLQNARFFWNFGDGGTAEGDRVNHTYPIPGVYQAVLDVSSSEYSASDRLVVRVIQSPLSISAVKTGVDGFIEISNDGDFELNLSFWIVGNPSVYFTLPKNTYIASRGKVVFPAAITNLNVSDQSAISLYYPNGVLAATYSESREEFSLAEISSAPAAPAESNVPPAATVKEEPLSEKAAGTEAESGGVPPALELMANVANRNQLTSVGVPGGKSGWSGNIFVWLFGLALMIIISIIGIAFLPSKAEAEEPKKLTADDFEIVD